MDNSYQLKPNKTAFVTYGFVKFSIFLLVLFSVIGLIASAFGVNVIYSVVAFLLLEAFSYYSINVAYKKEVYIFFPDKIVRKSGTIFSENETDLVVRNVTHMNMKLPFIEHKLFKTGNVIIESAGSGLSEISLLSINKPNEIYEYIQSMLKNNGFSLSKTELVQQEKPSSIGALFEVISTIFGGLFFFFFVFDMGKGLVFALVDVVPMGDLLLLFGTLVIFATVILGLVFYFFDLKNRVYKVYSDTITYSEGFFTKNYSIMPIENLSDSTVTQTLIDKIFGLYDVKISCQGSSQEVLFKNMVNGSKLEANIDALISKTSSLVGTKTQNTETIQTQGVGGEVNSQSPNVMQQQAYQKLVLDMDTTYTSEHKMDMKRSIAPIFALLLLGIIGSIFWLVVLLVIVSVVGKFIEVYATKYYIKEKNMVQSYNFIRSKNVEFSNDKITAVIFKENFLDKWFNTCSIQFWSIGSTTSIVFKNIKKSQELYKAVIAKTGIKSQEKVYEMNPNFSLFEMIKGGLFVSIALSLVILIFSASALFINQLLLLIPVVLIVAGYLILFLYLSVYQNKVKMLFFENYVYFSKGIFFEEFYFVLRDNIKGITTVKYPFSQFGTVQFNIAGELIVQQGKTTAVISNSFKVDFIENIKVKDKIIDLIFYKNLNAREVKEIEQNINGYVEESTGVFTAKPAVSNTIFVWSIPTVVGLLLVSLLFISSLPIYVPMLLILLIVILFAIVIWKVKVKLFSIESHRIIAKSGIVYKKQTSILFNKIDHLNINQGILNKMFGNGNVSVNTTGSSNAELVVVNVPNYREFFDKLKKFY